MDAKTVDRRAQHQPRLEDDPLVRGLGRYAADAPLTGQTYAYFVRSPHAFADIRSIDTEAAKAVPGVLAVLTAADMEGIGNISQHPPLAGRGGQKLIIPHRPALAGETVRHVGEAVAVVVGRDPDGRAGRRRGRRGRLRGAHAGGRSARGRARRRAASLAGGAGQYRGRLGRPGEGPRRQCPGGRSHHRIRQARGAGLAGPSAHPRASMEPRGATASYDPADESYFLRCCSQSARALRDGLAPILGVPNPRLRVITEDVGGAFGLKTGPYPEYLAILVAARKIGRPVHWMSNRAEAFLSDNHARDAYSDVELALDERGKFLALRIRHLGSMGAYIGAVGANIQTVNLTRCLPGMYDITLIDIADALRVHQHHDHRALSRRRPSGGELHPRAGDRRGRAHHRHRSDQAAPAQPDQVDGDAVQDRRRHHHRQRRVRDRARQGPGARRLRRLQAAAARGRQARQVPRARHLLHAGACRRLSARRDRAELSRRRASRSRPQRAVDRPGPRHGVQSHGGGAARHQAGADRAPARRLRDGDRGLCVGRLALRDDGEPCDDQDRRGAAGQGQEDRRHRRWKRRKPTSNIATAFRRGRHRPPHHRCSISRRAPRR